MLSVKTAIDALPVLTDNASSSIKTAIGVWLSNTLEPAKLTLNYIASGRVIFSVYICIWFS